MRSSSIASISSLMSESVEESLEDCCEQMAKLMLNDDCWASTISFLTRSPMYHEQRMRIEHSYSFADSRQPRRFCWKTQKKIQSVASCYIPILWLNESDNYWLLFSYTLHRNIWRQSSSTVLFRVIENCLVRVKSIRPCK